MNIIKSFSQMAAKISVKAVIPAMLLLAMSQPAHALSVGC